MQKGKEFYQGEGIYEKDLFVPAGWEGRRHFLRFEGVGSVSTLYINNKLAGEHRGAYSAFCFEITHLIKYGQKNHIQVKANNASRKDVIPVNHFLFGVYGGIYRPVSLISTNTVNITTTDYASPGVYITQKKVSAENAEISVKTKIDNKRKNPESVTVITRVYDKDGKEIRSERKQVLADPQGGNTIEQTVNIPHPHLWNGRKDHYLYNVKISLIQDEKIIDEVSQPLGLRFFKIIPGQGFFLNGKPYPMYGVTRHQDWWGYGSALTNEQHQADLDIICNMGATTVRLAHYQQAEYMYAKSDSLGLLIWAEIPFVNKSTGLEADNAMQQLKELIRQNYNHPGIYNWGLHNEVYDKTPDSYVSQTTRNLHDLATTEDPGRFNVSVSGYGEMNRPANLNTYIQGMNRYYGWYEGNMGDMEKWISGLEKDYPTYRLMLAEYGADGNIKQHSEHLPERNKIDPVNGQFSPEEYQTRTHVVQWGIIEKHPYITASYLWNTFDFATPMWDRGGEKARNLKGLVTFDRKEKKDAYFWYKANWNKEPMVYIAGRRNNVRKEATCDIEVFSNLQDVELIVNGKRTSHATEGATKNDHIFKNITLKKGNNMIKAQAKINGKKISDSMTWTLASH